MTNQVNDATGWYRNVFKHWPVKQVGPQPTVGDLHTVHMLGLRPGKQAMANAMALRPCGVTGAQIVIVCGAPQLNRMRGLIADGLIKREAVPPGEAGHTVYKTVLTAKGQARVKGAEGFAAKLAAAGDAPKPKATKPLTRKPVKAPAAEQPVSAPPVTTGEPNAPAATTTAAVSEATHGPA